MWRPILMVFGWLVVVLGNACSFDSTPKRLPAYVTPVPVNGEDTIVGSPLPIGMVTGCLVVINDTGFQRSAPGLQPGTLRNLGELLQEKIHQELPIHLSSIVYPEEIRPHGSVDQFIELAQDQNVPYLLLAILSSSEREVSDRLPLSGFQQPTGLRGGSLVGYRAENYAQLELALLDGQTGRPIVTTDGRAYATLERLAVPLESNVYPVVRREQSQAPIFPNSEAEAFETLRWISGQDAIAQAVMHLEQAWNKGKIS